jgi:hypothetical protein
MAVVGLVAFDSYRLGWWEDLGLGIDEHTDDDE